MCKLKMFKNVNGGGANSLNKASFGRKKRIEGIVIGIVVGIIITGGLSVAAVTLSAEQVTYTPTDESFDVSNTKEAIDELYKISGDDYKENIRNEVLKDIYPSGIVAEQNYKFDGEWTDTYSFSVTSPILCSKVVVTISGSHPENGVFLVFSDGTTSQSVMLNANYGTFTYDKKCKSVGLAKITFPEGYASSYFRMNVKMYY